MIIDLTDLKNKIKALKFGTNKSDLSGFGTYIFAKDKYLFTYNGTVRVSCPFDYDLEFAVPAAEFIQFIQKEKNKEIQMTVGDSLEIVSGKTEFSISDNKKILRMLDELPNLPEEFKRLPEDFNEGLKKCLISYSKDNLVNNPNICIDRNTIASTDSKRISVYDMEVGLNGSFLLPGKVLQAMYTTNVQFYSITDEVIHFTTAEDVTFSFVHVNDTFPNFDQLIERIDGPTIIFPDPFLTMLDKIAVVSKEEVIVTVKDGELMLAAQNGKGKILDRCPVEAEDIAFRCSTSSLKDALGFGSEFILDLSNQALLIEKDNFIHVVNVWEV